MLLSPFYRKRTKAEEIKRLPSGHSKAGGTDKTYLSFGPYFSVLVNNLNMKISIYAYVLILQKLIHDSVK